MDKEYVMNDAIGLGRTGRQPTRRRESFCWAWKDAGVAGGCTLPIEETGFIEDRTWASGRYDLYGMKLNWSFCWVLS